MEIYLHMNSV